MKQSKYEMSENIKIAVLEQNISQINDTLKRIEQDVKHINNRIWSNFLWLLSIIIGSTVGLAYMMAHGFRWF